MSSINPSAIEADSGGTESGGSDVTMIEFDNIDLSAHVSARRQRVFELKALWWRHPESPAVALAATSWLVLGVWHWAIHDRSANIAGTDIAGTTSFGFDPVAWMLMVVAMMVPGALAMIRFVGFNSMWHRRQRATAIFLAVYLLAWTAVGLMAWAMVRLLEQLTATVFAPDRTAIIAVTAVAVGWQLTRAKHRALRRCHLRTALAARGWAADRSVIRYSLAHGRACIASCWAIMAIMFVASHDFHLMVPLAVITIAERYQRRPNALWVAIAIAGSVAYALIIT